MQTSVASRTSHPWQKKADIARWLIPLILALLPLSTWLQSLGNPVTYFQYDLPPGQSLYVFAKLAGLYAFVLLWLQMMVGVTQRDPLFQLALPQSLTSNHKVLGIATLAVVWLHFLLFVAAVSLRKNGIAYDLLLPQFNHGIYFVGISLGWCAVAGISIVAFTGMMRTQSRRYWIYLHRLSAVVFALALVHSLMVGSETRTGAWLVVEICLITLLVIAAVRKYILHNSTDSRQELPG